MIYFQAIHLLKSNKVIATVSFFLLGFLLIYSISAFRNYSETDIFTHECMGTDGLSDWFNKSNGPSTCIKNSVKAHAGLMITASVVDTLIQISEKRRGNHAPDSIDLEWAALAAESLNSIESKEWLMFFFNSPEAGVSCVARVRNGLRCN